MNSMTNIVLPNHQIDDTEPLVIYTAGYYKGLSDHYIKRLRDEIAKETIVIYCSSGKGFLESEGTRYEVTEGMLVFCDAGIPHSYGANPSDPWTIHWAHFGGPFADYFRDRTGLAGLACTVRLPDLTEILPQMESMLSYAADTSDDLNRIGAFTCLRAALVETIKQIVNTDQSHQDPIIDKSIRIMTANLQKRLDLNDLAKASGLSKYHFVRQFKSNTGKTPMQYYNILKTEHAKKLLVSTDMTVSEISRILDYNTPYYFSESFKRHSGFSPKIYRQLHKRSY